MKLIEPMEPVLREEIFDDEDFTYQLKWDGVRMLAYVDNSGVKLINKRLNERTLQYPELQMLPAFINSSKVILDGEIVAFKDKSPSFPAVMRRDNARSEQSIKLLRQEVPVTYVVFDVLGMGDEDLRRFSLSERQQRLEGLLKPQEMFHVIQNFDSGSSLFAAVKKANLEGVVAKRKASYYVGGKKHRDWFKIKYRRRQACVVGGYTVRNGVANSLLLGVYRDGRLDYVGRAGSGLSEREWSEVNGVLDSIRTGSSPFAALAAKYQRDVVFVEPRLVAEVEFAEWTEDMHLRSPVIKGVSGKHDACLG